MMAAFSSRMISHSIIAVTVAIRSDCPAKHPSPKKSPLPRIATIASFPCSETTVIFTLPFWMWKTRVHPLREDDLAILVF